MIYNTYMQPGQINVFIFKKAAEEEKVKTEEQNENRGITVSGDGSWRRRGFSSLFGIVSLIGWFTGKVFRCKY